MGYRPPVELLAPAGNIEAFKGAICAGADAVYLGGDRFGARAYADNFTEDEIIWCIRYAHLFSRRVYLTVNTLVKESEFENIYGFIKPYYEAGLDGCIVQDIGVMAFLRENFPEMELHASTQMTITSVYGAEYVKKLGVCRVVPARELSLEEIKKIQRDTGLDIECFIHGAMCYSYSGQCLFSSILGGRSGNRGRCAQPCRLPYTVEYNGRKSKNCYPLSLKDMCTIEYIPDLIEAGIFSFKIEGRMKKPEYAAGVTSVYRKYIDLYLKYRQEYKQGIRKWSVSKEDMTILSKLYIRSEIQSGYYYKHNAKDMVTIDNPSYSGSDDALLDDIRSKYLDNKLKYHVNASAVFTVGKPAEISFSAKLFYGSADCSADDTLPITEACAYGDEVQSAQKQPMTAESIRKQLTKLGDTNFNADDVQIFCDDNIFYPVGKLNKLRRSAVNLLEEKIIEANGFLYRRSLDKRALDKKTLDKRTLDKRTLDARDLTTENCLHGLHDLNGLNDFNILHNKEVPGKSYSAIHVLVRTLPQLRKASQYAFFDRIYIDSDLIVSSDMSETIDICRILKNEGNEGKELIVALPYIIRLRDAEFLNRLTGILTDTKNIFLFSGFLVRSLDGLEFALEFRNKYNKVNYNIYTDAGFYIWNRQSLHQFGDTINGFCLPYELNRSEQRDLSGILPLEKIVYGRIPMMHSAGCVVKTTSGCVHGSGGTAVLTDRYNKEFPVAVNCIHCMNTIYNSVPLSLHSELQKLINGGGNGTKKSLRINSGLDFRLDFTLEDAEETSAVLEYFDALFNSEGAKTVAPVLPFAEYTTGHEKRGVE